MHEKSRKLSFLHHLLDPEPGSEAFAFDMCPRDGFERAVKLPPVIECEKKRGERPVMNQGMGCVTRPTATGRSPPNGERVPVPGAPRIEKQTFVDDIKCMNTNMLMLKTCGYYYEGLSRQEAKEKLRHRKLGAFLIRDSANPRFLFSLSVRTTRGTMCVRIEYRAGRWRMDCEDRLIDQMPEFANVVALMDFYIKLSRNDTNNQCVWLDSRGRRDTPVKLVTPVRSGVVSLQHACRLAINKHTAHPGSIEKLDYLPRSLKRFIQEYPYSH